MNPDDQQFDELFGASFRAFGERRGACPSGESLIAYLGGSLSVEEQNIISHHVSACGLCDSLLIQIREFDSVEPSIEPVGWHAIESRMRDRVFPQQRTLWSRLRAVAWHPAFAYAFGVVLCAAVFVVQRPARSPEFGAELGKGRNLKVTRSEDLAVPEKFLVLSFWIPTRPDYQYVALLDNTFAKNILSDDGKGNFLVAYRREDLHAGKHSLRITARDPRTGKELKPVEFSFEL